MSSYQSMSDDEAAAHEFQEPILFVAATPEPEEKEEPISHKRKASEPLEKTTDKDEASKAQQAEIKSGDHIYFEPRCFSNIELMYNGVTFHCHKVLLAKKSKFFEVALTGDQKCHHIEIPELQTSFKEIITPAAFNYFLFLMHDLYRPDAFLIEFLSSYAYLLYYFECDLMRENWAANNQFGGDSTSFIWLAIAIEYHWTEKLEIYDQVVKHMKYLLSNFECKKSIQDGWGYLNSETKIRLLFSVIDKHTLLPIPTGMLPEF